MKKIAALAFVAVVGALSAPAFARFAKPEDAIEYRQSALFIMAQNVGRIGAMAQGRVPFDAKVAAESAATAEFMSKLPWSAFGDGTQKGSIPTRAKPEIWAEKARFEAFPRSCSLRQPSSTPQQRPVVWTTSRQQWVVWARHAKPATTTSRPSCSRVPLCLPVRAKSMYQRWPGQLPRPLTW